MSDILRLSVFLMQPEKFSACVRNKETVRTNGRASAFIKWDVRKTPTWDVGQYSEE